LRRNCFLKHVIKGKINGRTEVKGRRGKGRKQLLDDLKEKRGNCFLKHIIKGNRNGRTEVKGR
jgi:hypothetical protein